MEQHHDMAIPILPSRSLRETLVFYGRLGFDGEIMGSDDYAILTRGPLELHFFAHPTLRPEDSWAGCYLRVADVDAMYLAFAEAALPRQGIPRMDGVENKPWGMREFAVVDADGNLLRVGQEI
jgi:catechol 2,3-dioxygenase-like lactoylglutathione lyase family enzyme